MNPTKVSVVIPCYNSADTIDQTLAGLSRQKTSFEYHIIVVNSSDDGTAEIVRQHFPGVDLIQLPERASAAKARNLGAEKASSRFIAFLDSDCLVTENWLQLMVDNYSDQYCGIGGPINNANPETSLSWAGYLLEFSDFFSCETPTPVQHIPSGNLLLLRSDFLKAGGFPEDFHFAQEDRLFSWILSGKTKKTFLFHPDIQVSHNHRVGLKQFLSHQYQIGRGGAEILKNTNLPGSKIVRNKVLMNLLLPILPFRKLFRCLVRALQFYPHILFKKPLVAPLMLLGQLYWVAGFGKRVNVRDNQA